MIHVISTKMDKVILVENPVEKSDKQQNIFLDTVDEDICEETWT